MLVYICYLWFNIVCATYVNCVLMVIYDCANCFVLEGSWWQNKLYTSRLEESQMLFATLSTMLVF